MWIQVQVYAWDKIYALSVSQVGSFVKIRGAILVILWCLQLAKNIRQNTMAPCAVVSNVKNPPKISSLAWISTWVLCNVRHRDCWYTCNLHKFETPALWFPCRVPVIPCKHLQCTYLLFFECWFDLPTYFFGMLIYITDWKLLWKEENM